MNSPARDEIVAGEAGDHEVGTDSVAGECPEIGVAQNLVDGIAHKRLNAATRISAVATIISRL
jgi:hypothetical protein